MSVILPLNHEFNELMDNEYGVLKKKKPAYEESTWRMVKTNENLFLHKSNVNAGKIFKHSFFKTLEINPVFEHPRKMARCQ